MTHQEILAALAAPMPFHWRIGPVNKDKLTAQCLAYIDARDAAARLNEILGLDWMCDYKQVGEVMYCGVGIKFDGDWRMRWDAGTESNTEAEKGEASDSFKRACVKWGLGAFLYDMPIQKVKMDPTAKFPVDDDGKRIWNLTEYINNLTSKETPQPAQQKQAAPKQATAEMMRQAQHVSKILHDGRVTNHITEFVDGRLNAPDFDTLFRKAAKLFLGNYSKETKGTIALDLEVPFAEAATDLIAMLIVDCFGGKYFDCPGGFPENYDSIK